MGLFAFLLLGLIAGAIAKKLLPGRQDGGWVATLVLGVLGAMIGGWLGSIIFDVKLGSFWSLSTWVLAIAGSALLLVLYGALTGRRGARH